MKKMKVLSTLMLATLFVLAVGCKNDEPGGGDAANVTFTPSETAIAKVTASDVYALSGSVSSQSGAVTDLQFIAVKKEGESYTQVGDPQSFKLQAPTASFTYTMDYIVDAKDFDHIQIRAYVGNASASTYVPVAQVEGELVTSVFFDDITMKADTPVWTGDNHPKVLSAGQAHGSSTPSFFSMHGTLINGEKKHVLNLNELRSVEGLNASFCFLNATYNTKNPVNDEGKLTAFGGQRGYMFSAMKASQLGGGTTGRQCDLYAANGKGVLDTKVDLDFSMKIVAGSWYWNKSSDPAGAEARFKFIDSLYLVLGDEANTTGAKVRANYLLGLIQKRLDNGTLGATGEGATSLGGLLYARKYTNAGSSSTSAYSENFRAGDYLVLRSLKDGKYYYGILALNTLYDDSKTFKDFNGLSLMDLDLSYDLFLKTNRFKVRAQIME